MKVAFGYGSDARVRGENQDAFGVFEIGDLVLGVVCDGVGGHTGGQQAATIAVQTLAESMQSVRPGQARQALIEAITAANRAIYEAARKSHRLMGMSTTIVACTIQGDRLTVAHVGDSRAYMIRGDVATALTRDHTMVNMFVDNDLLSPEDAASHPEAHVLARSLGSERQVDVDITEYDLSDEDVVILCSDGVHGAMTEPELAEGDWSRPATASRQLLRRVTARGGNDNATIIGFRVGGNGEPGMMPTPIPTLEQSGDVMTPSSADLIRTPDLLNEPLPPALYPIDPEDEPTAHSDDGTDPGDPSSPQSVQPPVMQQRGGTPHSPPIQRSPVPEEKKPPDTKRRPVVLIAAMAAGLIVMILLAAVLLRPQPPGPTPEGPEGPVVTNPEPRPTTPPPVQDDPDTDSPEAGGSVSPTPEPPQEGPVSGICEPDITHEPGEFARIRYSALPKNSQNPGVYSNPLPSPAPRIEINEQVNRRQGCSQVEKTVVRWIEQSSEYAPLWREYWSCHVTLNHAALEGAVDGPHRFQQKRAYLEGSPKQPSGPALPLWYLPAEDGVERRMDLYDEHAGSSKLVFEEVIDDAYSPEIVSCTFYFDLMAEAAYAQGFASMSNPDSEDVQDWARRVYTIRRHIDSRVGEQIRRTYPEKIARLERLLAEATSEFERDWRKGSDEFISENPGGDRKDYDWAELAKRKRLDLEVARAILVAAGELPPPTRIVVKGDDQPKPVRVDPCIRNPTDPECIPG